MICDHDRLGVLRPTLRGSVEHADWRTKDNWLHLDCNPTMGYASIGSFADDFTRVDFDKTLIIQGLLTLTDARVQDGGFHCVPGSHKFSAKWAKANQKRGSKNNMQVPLKDPLHAQIQKIPIRQGCLLAWTSLLFHGNHPNHSDRWRCVQYIRMLPFRGTPYSPLFPSADMYPAGFLENHPRARLLFGVDSYEEEEVAVEEEEGGCAVF